MSVTFPGVHAFQPISACPMQTFITLVIVYFPAYIPFSLWEDKFRKLSYPIPLLMCAIGSHSLPHNFLQLVSVGSFPAPGPRSPRSPISFLCLFVFSSPTKLNCQFEEFPNAPDPACSYPLGLCLYYWLYLQGVGGGLFPFSTTLLNFQSDFSSSDATLTMKAYFLSSSPFCCSKSGNNNICLFLML